MIYSNQEMTDSREKPPASRLAAAVILRAVDDLDLRRERLGAFNYFFAKGTNFEWQCALAGIEHEAVRERVRQRLVRRWPTPPGWDQHAYHQLRCAVDRALTVRHGYADTAHIARTTIHAANSNVDPGFRLNVDAVIREARLAGRLPDGDRRRDQVQH